eukprot:scaffold10354_cov68-Cyclotella_meneghiniana.AAC.1
MAIYDQKRMVCKPPHVHQWTIAVAFTPPRQHIRTVGFGAEHGMLASPCPSMDNSRCIRTAAAAHSDGRFWLQT